jgi:curved DNA-binding protein CbpA
MKDYYRILGVLDDAEDIIIKAAYRALAQRYHPDKWSGNQAQATKRMAEINEAYSVLSNAVEKKKYDEAFFKFKERDKESNTFNDEFADENIDEIDEAWITAVSFFPSIRKDFLELQKINFVLANTYKTHLIERQNFKEASQIKSKYENDYLIRYYGNDNRIREFAKFLLLNNERGAAHRVNAIVKHMGSSIGYDQLHQKLVEEFPSISNKEESEKIEKKIINNLKYLAFSSSDVSEIVKSSHEIVLRLALNNNFSAQFAISKMYWRGHGTQVNKALGYAWRKICSENNSYAMSTLSFLIEKMTADELNESKILEEKLRKEIN